MLTCEVAEFTRPKNSSMIFGGWPAAGITVGDDINFAMGKNYSEFPRGAIDLFLIRELDSPDEVASTDGLKPSPPGEARVRHASPRCAQDKLQPPSK
jgi:hypothetical protein